MGRAPHHDELAQADADEVGGSEHLEPEDTDIHPDAVGRGLEVLCLVTMQTSTATVLDDFEAAALCGARAARVPPALRRDVDFLLRVGVADLGSYQRLYDATLSRLPGVARVQSTITMKVVKARFDDRTERRHSRR